MLKSRNAKQRRENEFKISIFNGKIALFFYKNYKKKKLMKNPLYQVFYV